MAADDIDLEAGSSFSKTITGATTLTVSNAPAAGRVASFVLDLTNPGSNVTWWAGIIWPGGAVPTGSASGRDRRSEEHQSELQSLMRTSYAAFCLKQKILHTTTERTHM